MLLVDKREELEVVLLKNLFLANTRCSDGILILGNPYKVLVSLNAFK